MTIPQISTSHVAYDIALTLIQGVRPQTVDPLLDVFGDPYSLFAIPENEIRQLALSPSILHSIIEGRRRKLDQAYSIFEHCNRSQIKILIKGTPSYPKLLAQCPDAPYVLYCRGNTDFNSHKLISCVGTRSASMRGVELCKKLIDNVCSSISDVAIVSGLARGIDSVAHRAALDNSVPTIAVMPGWVDDITPRSHYSLVRNILLGGGAVLSEMPPDTQIGKLHFISRNRIVAGMSHATIMMQSGLSGGSMITADMANGYNRDVFTPAADPADPSFAGNISLLRSDRAIMLGDAADICTAMGWKSNNSAIDTDPHSVDQMNADQLAVYAILPENDPFTIDQIIEQTRFSVAKTSALLTSLEIKGVIKTLKGRLYIRN